MLDRTIRSLSKEHPELAQTLAKWKPRIVNAVNTYCFMFAEEDPEDVSQSLLLDVVRGLLCFDSTRSSMSSFVFRQLHNSFVNLVAGKYLMRNGYVLERETTRSGRTLEGFKKFTAKRYRREVSEIPEHLTTECDGESRYDEAPETRTPEFGLINQERIEYIRSTLGIEADRLLTFLLSEDDSHIDRVRRSHVQNYCRKFGVLGDLDVGDQQDLVDIGTPVTKGMTTFASGMRFRRVTCERYLAVGTNRLREIQAEIFSAFEAYDAG